MLSDGRTLVFRHGPSGDTQLYYSIDTSRTTSIDIYYHDSSPSGETLRAQWNPIDGIELLIRERPGSYPVRVYNIMGQALYEGNVMFAGAQQPFQGRVNLGQLPTGNYFVTVRMRNSQYASKFIITT